MNKRVGSIFLLILLVSSILINVSLVSAQGELNEGIQEVGSEISQALAPILKFLFNIEKETGTGITQGLLSFIYAFIIILVFLLFVRKQIPWFEEQAGLGTFLIVIFSILATRGIAQLDVIEDLFFPAGAIGITLVTGGFFIALFALINIGLKADHFKFMRRFLWILFAVSFIVIWWQRRTSIGTLGWIYIITGILALVMAFMDGSIQGAFAKMEAEKIRHIGKTKRRAAFKSQLKAWKDMVQDGTLAQADFNLLEKDLQKRARILGIKGKL